MPVTSLASPSPPWEQLYRDIALVLPHVIAGLTVLVLGVISGVVAGRVAARVLRATRLDRRATNAGVAGTLQAIGVSSPAKLAAASLKWFIIFTSAMVARYLLDSPLASGLTERFLLYLPHFGGALLVLAGGTLVARFLSRSVLIAAVNREVAPARLFSGLTRVGVMALAVAIAFEQAQIGYTTVLVAFAIALGGVTLVLAIAVGLALRDVVARWLQQHLDASRKAEDWKVFQHL